MKVWLRCWRAPSWTPVWFRRLFPGCWTEAEIADARSRAKALHTQLVETGVIEPGCGCEFGGSLADQVFQCVHCGAYPEDCADGDCGCRLRPRRCGHCGEPDRGIAVSGYATVGGTFLCHPNAGMDCYRLVTVHGHSMPCDQCSALSSTNPRKEL